MASANSTLIKSLETLRNLIVVVFGLNSSLSLVLFFSFLFFCCWTDWVLSNAVRQEAFHAQKALARSPGIQTEQII